MGRRKGEVLEHDQRLRTMPVPVVFILGARTQGRSVADVESSPTPLQLPRQIVLRGARAGGGLRVAVTVCMVSCVLRRGALLRHVLYVS